MTIPVVITAITVAANNVVGGNSGKTKIVVTNAKNATTAATSLTPKKFNKITRECKMNNNIVHSLSIIHLAKFQNDASYP